VREGVEERLGHPPDLGGVETDGQVLEAEVVAGILEGVGSETR
jgi:hypothetical protein